MYEELKARLRLCDQPNKGWPLMIEAADAIEQLERQLAERDAEIAKYRDAPVVAWANLKEDNMPCLLSISQHTEDRANWMNPKPLIVKPGEQ